MKPRKPVELSPPLRWLPAVIIAAGVLVYLNSFAGAFVFDDFRNIVDNEHIRRLWPIWESMKSSRPGGGQLSRPFLGVTLAVNYALGELNVWGYHFLNLVVHLIAALALFGIVRRTLLLVTPKNADERSAAWTALSVALLWVVHPLQTQSVTYIIQRGESMMGMFYLLTLYCVIRGSASRRAGVFYVAAVACCGLGMGSKGIMVTVPVTVLLYDRVFLSRTFGVLARARWSLYLGLAATWSVLVACGLVGRILDPARPTVRAELGAGTTLQYVLTQPGVILHYLKLSFWPRTLCLDYWSPVAWTTTAIVLPVVVVVALLLVTLWALCKKPPLGFVGAWFFLILAPTSLVPLRTIYEHRMYLPLASVIVLVVLGVGRALEHVFDRRSVSPWTRRWISGGLVAVAAAALGCGTVQRNKDYRSAEAMWTDVVAKRPHHAPARYNLANLLAERGRIDQAIELYNEALAILPKYPEAHNNLGNALLGQGKLDQAMDHFARALQLEPDYPEANSNMGLALIHKGMSAESVPYFAEALRLKQAYPEAHNYLGVAWLAQGKPAKAVSHLTEAVRLRPDYAEAHGNLGAAFRSLGELDRAVEAFTESLRADPGNVISQINLGLTLADQGKTHAAIESFRNALRLDPLQPIAHTNLGIALSELGKVDEAIVAYRKALEIDPDYVPARERLNAALDQR